MKKQDLTHLDHRVAEAEKRTGAQIVLAVIGRSDSYPELPWKAFALGTALAALPVFAMNGMRPGWASGYEAFLSAALPLGAGILCVLLCLFAPAFARLFLDAHRASTEVRQYASSLFLTRELFATRGRTGILLLVSLFERRVVVLPDTGLETRLGRDALQAVVARMTKALREGEISRALEEGLASLEEALAPTAPGEPGENELPDGIIEEKGS